MFKFVSKLVQNNEYLDHYIRNITIYVCLFITQFAKIDNLWVYIYSRFILLCVILFLCKNGKKIGYKIDWKLNADWLFICVFHCAFFCINSIFRYVSNSIFRLSDDEIFFVDTDTSQMNNIRYFSFPFSLLPKQDIAFGASMHEEIISNTLCFKHSDI